MAKLINAEMAFAVGALNGGVQMITGYPGSPSSGAFEALKSFREDYELKMEWSLNEKVACEVAIGSSIGGLRTLICVKSVGLNVMIDPLMALNLTPLNAGLVILLGDDPQGYGSQNDQDSRPFANALEMPLWEPATVEDACQMMSEAFNFSEQVGLPVIIRETRSFSQSTSDLEVEIKYNPSTKEIIEEPFRFVPVPKNVVEKHLLLQKSLTRVAEIHDKLSFNTSIGKGNIGIIASGFVFSKVRDVFKNESLDDVKVLKLETLFPLPEKLISEFLSSCDQVIILEESSCFIEQFVKVIAWDHGVACKIYGKKDIGLQPAGELFKWQIKKALEKIAPDLPMNEFTQKEEALEHPKMKSNCLESRYEEVITLVDQAAEKLGVKPLYVGDPGCIFLAGEKLVAKYAIGSATALASGLDYAEVSRPIVAFVGDSGFFHTSIPAIANASYSGRNFLIILIDNGGALTTGLQPTPAHGINLFAKGKKNIRIEEIANSIGVSETQSLSLDEPLEINRALISKLQNTNALNLVIIKIQQ